MKKNLISMLGALAIGAAVMMPMKAEGQELRIVNYSPSFSPQVKVQYLANTSDTVYTNPQANSLEVYDLEGSVKSKIRGVNTSQDRSLFKIVFSYKGAVSNGIYNSERIQFFNGTNGTQKVSGNSFSNSNLLVTYKILDNAGQEKCFDLGKECAAAGTNAFEYILQSPTNVVPGVYATNYLSFARKESAIPNLEVITGDSTNATVNVSNVLPGENIILESRTNLTDNSSWLPIKTNYVSVTSDNFGTTDSTTFSVPADKPKEFFRARVQ